MKIGEWAYLETKKRYDEATRTSWRGLASLKKLN